LIIDERRAAAEKLLADAASARDQAEKAAAEVQARLRDSSADAERMLTAARLQAESERARLLAEAADSAVHLRDEAKSSMEVDRAAMERTLRQRACDLAVVIARRLLLRLPAKTATAALLESLKGAMAEVPEARRRDLASAGPVEIVTAVPLDQQQQTECRAMMGGLFGEIPSLLFRTDPALLAGVELHTRGLLIRDSWRADLERIADELNQDEQHEARSEHLV
jgi:F-type H+-transporting ATPase subunit b